MYNSEQLFLSSWGLSTWSDSSGFGVNNYTQTIVVYLYPNWLDWNLDIKMQNFIFLVNGFYSLVNNFVFVLPMPSIVVTHKKAYLYSA